MYKAGLVFILLVALTGLTSAAPEVCHFQGKTYAVGEYFITQDCSASCHCTPQGGVGCVDLCPTSVPNCGPGEVLSEKKIPMGDGRCKCSLFTCAKTKNRLLDDMFDDYTGFSSEEPEVCKFKGKTYPVGQKFITQDCSGRCHCTIPAGVVECVDLCPTLVPNCGTGEVVSKKMVPVGDGRCKCPQFICIKTKNRLLNDMSDGYTSLSSAEPEVCQYKGKTYPVGQKFITQDCSARCHCTIPAGGVECVDLCPTLVPKCGPGDVVSKKMVPVGDGRCKCPQFICVKTNNRLLNDMSDYYRNY